MTEKKDMKRLGEFEDVHTHRLDAGEHAIVNLPEGAAVPDFGYYSVGLHPWHTDRPEMMVWVRTAATHPRVVAIGETGLDALRGAPMEEQERLFRAHVDISESEGKPLIIHAVRTLQRLIELRRELRPAQEWVIHGFRGKPQLAQSLLRAGFSLSYGDKYHAESFSLTPPERRYRESD